MTHAIFATWKATPGKAEEVETILLELARETRREPGVLMFVANRGKEARDTFVLYEQYVDEAAFRAHQQTSHFRHLVLERALPLLAHRERVPFDVLP
ncbi:MAG: antibiotic biosynthesis monooxygenase [Xanthobacteraceae bacterium]|nr:antibiotic biosynthesis monooxygenase [Xanthobacteraceae bacterium]